MSGISKRAACKRRQLIELVGYAGSASLLGVYMLMLAGRLDGHGVGFNLGMLVGCALLGLNMAAHRAWPGVITQAAFVVVAALALIHIFY
jgi:hypothetical protein